MRWFHHDTDMHRNRKIRKLIRVHGATGYAFWCVLLEKLYDAENGFQIEADELWFEDMAEDLKLGDYRTPIRILDTLADLGLIDSQLWQEHVVYAPSIAKRGDNYIIKRTQEREKKRRYREKLKVSPQASFAEIIDDLSTVDSAGTAGQTSKMSPSDPDPDPDPDPDLKTEDIYICGLDLKKEVEILEPEPEAASTQPAESGQSSEALTTQQEVLSETKSSAAAKNTRSQKKPSAAECEEARRIYNECRPDNGSWARCDVMNADRINVFTRLWVDAAQQGRDWRDILRDALAFAKLDDWWSDPAKCFEFSTLFHKRNYQKFSEKLAAKGAIASRVHESGMSTEDINLAKKIAEDRALCERLGVEYY